MTKKDRWILSEFLVAKDRCANFHEHLRAHQFRTPFAEVDLIFQTRASEPSLTIVEVKSSDGDLWSREILSWRQRQRLVRAREWLEARTGRSVRLTLAAVSAKGRIDYFDFPL